MCSRMMKAVIIALLVVVVVTYCEARSRGGGSSSGGYRGGSSYRSSSYRSSSYRSSSYSSYRGGSRYVPGTIRYSRSYAGSSYYRSYLSAYYYMYVPASYRTTGNTYNEGAKGNICKNYQANENGTTLGVFKCPLDFEPADHTYCCGERELEYCCKLKDSSVLYGIIFGVLIGVGVIVVGIVLFIKCYLNKSKVNEGNANNQQRNSRQQASVPPPYMTSNPNVYNKPEAEKTTQGYSMFANDVAPPAYDGYSQPPAPPYQTPAPSYQTTYS